ncbi:MAG: hypothetical protein FJ296_10280 [Planctomycetes bacterium]|nr:hypothetical protein [Planctomycetota bacterium]
MNSRPSQTKATSGSQPGCSNSTPRSEMKVAGSERYSAVKSASSPRRARRGTPVSRTSRTQA